ncbi:right-handed parallel beta-helix repeat-containing protein [Prosthecobacter sp.]|uniref:beta strand repeat-containing protein n=1 Tax=Prosthecobacter sp. TaxID=1965333 RepID=UPI002ABC325A|nr:right-handed parallel beta-helix repeat-containing protein [Prosthecobacter sp.]MDZ4405918.1 right-handed parallel beta-helix repeat-containing protein [Prosthecobacter sp.]
MTKLLARALALIAFTLSAQGDPLSGTKTIGPTGDYSSIGAAIVDIQVQTLSGALVLELQAAYVSTVETFPLTFTNLGTTAVNTLTLRPQTGAASLSISSADTTAATVDLNGAQFLTLDGRPGGTGTVKQLTIANTSTSGVALRFVNEASGNLICYTVLKGVNTNASSGVIRFSTTTGANGNDDNILDHCEVCDGASTPANGIYSIGTINSAAQNNSGNLVSNCNIFNFYSGSVDAAGVRLEGGNTGWTFTGNSFYQTTSRVAVAANIRAIYVNSTSGNNFAVTGNFIGGSAPNAGGAPWTTTGTTALYMFQGIRLSAGTSTPSNVQGNTIQNIVWTSAFPGTGQPGAWEGVYLGTGAVNVGTITGNTIGSGSGTGSVSVTTSGTGATTFGIRTASSGTVTIANNTIGAITVNGTDTSITASLTGISASVGTNTISNNTVGSITTANSLNAATSSTSSTSQQVTGIFVLGLSTSASITGNTLANLNNNSSAAGQIRGIVTSAGVNTITGNTVRNLTTTSQNANTTTLQSVYGIIDTSTVAGQTVSQNTVHSLANTAATAAVSVTGIYFDGPTSGVNVIERNLVHSLAVSSNSASSQLNGMQFVIGVFTAQNNMVRVGRKADGTSTAGAATVRGLHDNGADAGRNFYHNSVYVGGTQTSGAASTRAFQGTTGVGNARTYQNNIFVNARGNSGATSKHYAVSYGGSGVNPAGLTAGGNIFRVSGTGGVLGFYSSDRSTLAAWQAATGQDATSAVADPLFSNPTGNASTVDLHLQASNPAEGGGIPLTDALTAAPATVTDDFDGQPRNTLTPADIGADAGNFTSTGDIFAPGISYPQLTDTLSLTSRALTGFATITDNVGVSGGAKSPRLYFKKSTDADAFNVPNNSTGNGWKYATAGNATSPYDFTVDYSLLNGSGVANGDTIQYFVVAQDEANNLISSPSGAASSASPPVQNVSAKPGSMNSYRVGDITAPTISFPLLSNGSTASRVLTGWATITDAVGMASGASAPRLYFKKSTDADAFGVTNDATGNGWKYVVASGSGPYSFTLDYSVINGGSVAVGDSIQYFVVAQDAANNLGSSPAGATASADPPVQNISAKPGTVRSFSIAPSISGTVTVGSGGTYPSLSGAGGLFAALNGALLTGDVVVKITSDLAETGGVTLNPWQEEGAGNYTFTIQPDSATMQTISGSAAAGLITLNGADRVSIDGRFGGSGRYLTFRNTNPGESASTLLFVNDASSNTVRNCVVEGASLNSVILFSSGTVTGNDNNLITGCQVRDLTTAAGVPYALIGSPGAFAAEPNSGNTIANNELFNFNAVAIYVSASGNDSWTISGNNIYEVNAATLNNYGIFMLGGGTNVITGNYIHDLLTSSGLSAGIYFSLNSTTTIARNRITALDVNAATTFVFGIFAQSSTGSLNVVNNQITLSPATSGSTTLYGMFEDGSSAVNVYYNSIVLGGTESGTRSSWASLRRTASTHTVRDNIFLNFRTGGSASHFAAGSEGGSGSYTASHNLYAGSGAGGSADFMDFSTTGDTVPMSFATWQSSTGETNSQAGLAGSGSFTAALFANAATGDLHLVPGGNPLVNATGIPIAGVTDDYDGNLRSLTTPSIGADEAVAAVGIAGWRQQFFGVTTNSGNAADTFDYDHDGLPNLIEWACNLSPTTASTLPASAVRNGAEVEFTYTRSVIALNAGTGFVVEWSDTLANDWQSTGVNETILSDNGTVQQVKATLPAGSAGRRFVHLKVTSPPG